MTTGARLDTLLAAITAEILAALPALKTCDVHDGAVDFEEIRRWSRAAPAVLVASLGAREPASAPGERWVDVEQDLAAYVLARDAPELPRGEAARNIVDQVLLILPRARWGAAAPGIGEARRIRAHNLYNGKLDRMGIALCAVEWRQTLRLEEAVDEDCPETPDDVRISGEVT